jgi:hypothetical protein
MIHKIKFTLLTLLTVITIQSSAQLMGNTRLSLGDGLFMAAQGFEIDFTLGEKANFHITPGARLSVMGVGSGTRYLTAPAKLTKDDKNMDTIVMPNNVVAFTNLYLKLSYDLHKRIYLGFDIDVLGFSLGGSRENLEFLGGEKSQQSGAATGQVAEAKPTLRNQLVMGDLDRGSLNSTFFAGVRVTDNFSVEAGLSFVFTEFTTNRKEGGPQNDRFRNKAGLITLGASYRLTGK